MNVVIHIGFICFSFIFSYLIEKNIEVRFNIEFSHNRKKVRLFIYTLISYLLYLIYPIIPAIIFIFFLLTLGVDNRLEYFLSIFGYKRFTNNVRYTFYRYAMYLGVALIIIFYEKITNLLFN